MTDPVKGPELRPPGEGIQRPLTRGSRSGKSKWRSRRPVELIVGPFYRAANIARRPTKRQAFLFLVAAVVLGFLLTATWSLAGRIDPGHDPQWSHAAPGAVGPIALSRDGDVLVAAVTTGPTSFVQAFRVAGEGDPFARIAFHGLVTHLLADEEGARALVAVSPEDLVEAGVVGPGPDERGGPALYLVDLGASAVLRTDPFSLPARAVAASGDLSVVALAFPNFDEALVTLDGRTLVEHAFQEPPTAVAVSRDGAVAAFGSRDGELALLDLEAGTNVTHAVPNHEATGVALSANGSRLVAGFGASANRGGRVLFFEAYAPALEPAWELTTELPVAEVGLGADGDAVVARTVGGEPLLLGARAERGEAWNVALSSAVEHVRLSEDGSTVALAYTFSGVEARRASSGATLWTFNEDRNESRIEATALALSADGSVIASNGRQAGDGEPVRLLVFDRDREGGLLGPLWTKVLLAGLLETAAVITVLVLWEKARSRRQSLRAASRR